jgi:hypothetical protein
VHLTWSQLITDIVLERASPAVVEIPCFNAPHAQGCSLKKVQKLRLHPAS